jgi:hypothetical protein
MFKDGVSVDRVVGFEQLGGRDDFSTAAVEARLKAASMVSSSRKAGLAGLGADAYSDDEDEATAGEQQRGIRRGFVHKDADDESSDFDD